MKEFLRKVELEDVKILYDWANDPVARNNSVNKNTISWEGHQKWFQLKLESPSCYMFILMLGDNACGQVRFDQKSDCFEIDYSIDSQFRGKGLGARIIKLGMQTMEELTQTPNFQAIVSVENIPSQRVLQRCNFKKLKEELVAGDLYIRYLKV